MKYTENIFKNYKYFPDGMRLKIFFNGSKYFYLVGTEFAGGLDLEGACPAEPGPAGDVGDAVARLTRDM